MITNCYGIRVIGQLFQLNHSLWKFTPEFLGLFDLDEYICINKDINIFDKSVSVLSFPNYWFGCNNGVEYNFNNFIYKLTKREKNTNAVVHLQRKCIYQSKYVDLVCVHNVLNVEGICKILTYDEGYIRHYRIISNKQRRCDCNIYCQVDDNISKI
jgi:hypothetical protein